MKDAKEICEILARLYADQKNQTIKEITIEKKEKEDDEKIS